VTDLLYGKPRAHARGFLFGQKMKALVTTRFLNEIILGAVKINFSICHPERVWFAGQNQTLSG